MWLLSNRVVAILAIFKCIGCVMPFIAAHMCSIGKAMDAMNASDGGDINDMTAQANHSKGEDDQTMQVDDDANGQIDPKDAASGKYFVSLESNREESHERWSYQLF